jgi:acyl-coenzyme A thioesterase PaaI-like protein
VDAPPLEALQDLVSTQAPFARPFGFRVQAAANGECALLVPFDPSFERPGGIVAGHVFMAAADVAMWLAVKTRRGREDDSVTVSLTSTFLRSARREDMVCRARVTKAGSRLSHGTAECARLSGEVLSQHTLIYVRPR